KIQGPSEFYISFLTFSALVAGLPQGHPSRLAISTKRGHFRGLQREAIVRPPTIAIQREMLFDQCSAERYAGDRSGIVQCMIRQTRHQSITSYHVRDRAQVVIMSGGGVAADAMQDSEFFA